MKAKRLISVVLIFALACVNWSCTKAVTVKSNTPKHPKELVGEKIVGITTVKGAEIPFDEPGGKLAGTTIIANVAKESRSFPLSDVQHVWMEKRKLTTGAKVGIVAGATVVAIIVVAAISLSKRSAPIVSPSPSTGKQSSCPFVYSWDGSQFCLDGEPYGGAIARGLARDDWSELRHLRDINGEYRVLMTNEADETQHTDLAELWVADHPAGVRVVADGSGRLIGLSNLQRLLKAQEKTGRDLTTWLDAKDRRIWEPEPVPDAAGSLQHEIILTFPKPAAAKDAWLVSNMATGAWGSQIVKDMVSLLGRDANAWLESLDKNFLRATSVYQWVNREETLRLKVDVEESSGWRTQGSFSGGGPIIAEDRVVPIDVSGVSGDRLRLRVRPPCGFWAINSFEIAYDSVGAVPFTRISAESARTSDGTDVLKELASANGAYYTMPTIGDAAELRFRAPIRRPAMERTFFLHTAGWYQIHLGVGGEPDQRAFNEVLNTPGAIVRFTEAQYDAWKHSNR